MKVQLNGDHLELGAPCTVAELLDSQQLTQRRVAVEINGEIIPRSEHPTHTITDGDRIEIVHALGGGWFIDIPDTKVTEIKQDIFTIGSRTFRSRLLTGTGKFKDLPETRAATLAAGAEIVTVAIRRTNIGQNPGEPNLLDVLPPNEFTLLPNTAGCYTAEDAVRTCRLARELLDGHNLVKLEVLGDQKTLYPDVVATLTAAEQLVADGFEVMVYTSDDPILAKRLEEIGCVAVMPLAAPIGSGLGIQNKYNLLEIIESANVPIIVDAGVGTASDASIAMELGCDGVLMNTAIAGAKDPVLMARAMKYAVEAGRLAFKAGRIPRKRFASASSPIDGLIG